MATDLTAHAHALLDANAYATLATVDAAGMPWASPVYFAYDAGARRLLWLSRPDARHSRNIAVRAEVSAVVFDSTVAIGTAQALYLAAQARELAGDEMAAGVATYSARSVAHGVRAWSVDDVSGATDLRLYGADVVEASVLDPGGPDGRGSDRRLDVMLR